MSHLIRTFTTFAKDLTSLERTIRFVEACFQLVALKIRTPGDPESVHFLHVASQLNLVRRFFRIFDWIDCLLVVTSVKPGLDPKFNGIWHILDLARWLALTGFFFLDMLVLPNALGFKVELYNTASDIQIQSLACWFHYIVISIVLALKEAFTRRRQVNTGSGVVKRTRAKSRSNSTMKKRRGTKVSQSLTEDVVGKEVLEAPASVSWTVYEELLTSCCDFVIPAHFCNYFVTNMVIVSIGMASSSLITMISKWHTISAKIK